MNVNLMTLGDSITAGTGGYDYRIELDPQLRAAGIDANFVGSQFDGTYHHEGHPGYTIEQIAANVDGWLAAAGEPQVITLLAGTNDMGPGVDPAGPLAALQSLADQIFADDPTADLIISTIPPLTDGSPVTQYNSGIANVVAAERAHGHAAFEATPDLTLSDLSSDNVHPNPGGYNKIGDAFAAAVETALGVTPAAAGGGSSIASPFPDQFYGNGTSDAVAQDGTGQVTVLTMQNGAVASTTAVGMADPSWHIAGTGDFNGDGDADIFWQNDNGALALWEMNGAAVASAQQLQPMADPSWHVAGIQDFYGDGHNDILWRNDDGTLALWEMNGGTVTQAQTVQGMADGSWQVVGTGDFNGDGKADILWENANGQLALWEMNGAAVASAVAINATADPSWHAVGTGDFYGDGHIDVLWQNDNGQLALWEMNGAAITNAQAVQAMADRSWQVVGTGDYDGDGKADILWQHSGDGALALWTMNGNQIVSATAPHGASDWHLA